MLILDITDGPFDGIRIGDNIKIKATQIINRNKVEIGVDAPKDIPIGKAKPITQIKKSTSAKTTKITYKPKRRQFSSA